MGGIDLKPASSKTADAKVGVSMFYRAKKMLGSYRNGQALSGLGNTDTMSVAFSVYAI